MGRISESVRKRYLKTTDRGLTLTDRMAQFYLMVQTVWLFVCGTVFCAVRMPVQLYGYFLGLVLIIVLAMLIGVRVDVENKTIYALGLMVALLTPVTWYVIGGNKSSGTILFGLAFLYYVFCNSGKRRKVFLVIGLIEPLLTNVLPRRFPMLGAPIWAEGRVIPVCNSIIGLTASLVMIALLTKQVQEFERERQASEQYEKNLEKSNKLQKMFLANMSHEIRSPLGIVLGFNDLIATADSMEQVKEYSKNISSAGETLKVVINDILDYSKIESGKLDIIERDYSLHELLKEIQQNILLKAEEKGLKFSVEYSDKLPNYLHGDDIRVRQCLINILSNAVKYTDEGEITLTVSSWGIAGQDNCNLRFLCHDTGRGISPEAQQGLFTAFQRLDEGHNRGIEGTGLGLAITKTLVEEMGGNITVNSTLGVGSDFSIQIPQRRALNNVESHSSQAMDLGGVNVAVVDDTKPNLILCRKILEKENASVEVFSSGAEFLAACAERKYDVLLIDHMMPEMDGVEVLKRIQDGDTINRETPRIVFTANAMAEAEKEYLELGFDGYVTKPINKDLLTSKIKSLVVNNKA